jgi:hypothetical protein
VWSISVRETGPTRRGTAGLGAVRARLEDAAAGLNQHHDTDTGGMLVKTVEPVTEPNRNGESPPAENLPTGKNQGTNTPDGVGIGEVADAVVKSHSRNKTGYIVNYSSDKRPGRGVYSPGSTEEFYLP